MDYLDTSRANHGISFRVFSTNHTNRAVLPSQPGLHEQYKKRWQKRNDSSISCIYYLPKDTHLAQQPGLAISGPPHSLEREAASCITSANARTPLDNCACGKQARKRGNMRISPLDITCIESSLRCIPFTWTGTKAHDDCTCFLPSTTRYKQS